MKNPAATVVRFPDFPGLLLKTGDGAHAERIHAHAEHSIGFVLRGGTRVTTPAGRVALESGQFISIPAGTAHLCAPENPERFAYAVLYFDETARASSAVFGVFDRAMVLTGWLDRIPDPFVFTSGGGALESLLSECASRIDGSSRPGESILDGSGFPAAEPGDSRFRRYREFRGRFGVGAHACLQNRRIEKAKKLLVSEMPLAEIALESGFCDQSHFIRTFRLYTGMRPSDYRAAFPALM